MKKILDPVHRICHIGGVSKTTKTNTASPKGPRFQVHTQTGMEYFDTSSEAIDFAIRTGREYIYHPAVTRWVRIDKVRYVVVAYHADGSTQAAPLRKSDGSVFYFESKFGAAAYRDAQPCYVDGAEMEYAVEEVVL